jgi:hypothetical protein
MNALSKRGPRMTGCHELKHASCVDVVFELNIRKPHYSMRELELQGRFNYIQSEAKHQERCDRGQRKSKLHRRMIKRFDRKSNGSIPKETFAAPILVSRMIAVKPLRVSPCAPSSSSACAFFLPSSSAPAPAPVRKLHAGAALRHCRKRRISAALRPSSARLRGTKQPSAHRLVRQSPAFLKKDAAALLPCA